MPQQVVKIEGGEIYWDSVVSAQEEGSEDDESMEDLTEEAND